MIFSIIRTSLGYYGTIESLLTCDTNLKIKFETIWGGYIMSAR